MVIATVVIVFFAMAFIVVTFVSMAVISVPMISVVPVSVSMDFGAMAVMAVVFVSVIFVLTVVAPTISVMIVMLRSGVFLTVLFAAFLIALMGAVGHFVSMVFVPPDIVMLRVVMDSIRMVIFVAVHPRPLPGSVVDEDHATVP